jgi:hypothetical protein
MKEVFQKDLIPGKEYYMECFTTDESGNLVSNNPPYKMIAKFKNLCNPSFIFPFYQHSCFTNFRKIQYKNKKNNGYYVELNDFWKFYEIVEDKVQQDMEKRATDTALQQIIRDEYFRLEFI